VTSLAGCATIDAQPLGRVVVVGGGYGGATAAKYIRIWSEGRIDVTLVEPAESFVSCPMSNLVIGGSRKLAEITVPYSGLAKYGVRMVRDSAVAVDPDKRTVRLAGGSTLEYDRLVLSPGIEVMFEAIRGMTPAAVEQIPHAWRAGPQTALLRRQLEAMPDGGVVVMSGLPDRPLHQDLQAEEQADRARCQSGYRVQAGPFRRGIRQRLQVDHRLPQRGGGERGRRHRSYLHARSGRARPR